MDRDEREERWSVDGKKTLQNNKYNSQIKVFTQNNACVVCFGIFYDILMMKTIM